QIKKHNASFLPFFMVFATLGEEEIPSPPCRGRISDFRDRLYISLDSSDLSSFPEPKLLK
ncbi:MAG: hypothetical protein ABSH28_04775, partial [Acidobacteriota bacterium]